jgi:PST family polysaccharide transporter
MMSRRSHRGERREAALPRAEAEEPSAPRPDSSLRAGSDAVFIGAGYLVSFAYPLVSLPLLSRVLGAHDLGQFLLALALVQLVVFVADFGFGKSAVRRISVARTREERSQIAAASFASILLLWSAAATVLMSIVLLVPQLREEWTLYLVGVLVVGVGVLYPDWLLQGRGRVRSFTLIMVFSRLIALVLLVLTVRTPGELVLPMLWQQFPLALSAVIAWFMVLVVWRDARVVRTSVPQIRDALTDSAPMFVTGFANLAISGSNTIALGVVSTPVHIAFFGAAERFGNAVRGVMHGIVDAMLPRMARGGEGDRAIQTAIMVGVMGSYALAGIGLVVLSPLVIPWYLGDEMRGAVLVTQIIGISLLPSGVVTALFLRATGQHRFRVAARFAVIGAICHVVLLFPAGWLWGSIGAAGVAIVSETTIAALYLIDAVRQRRRTRSAERLAVDARAHTETVLLGDVAAPSQKVTAQ